MNIGVLKLPPCGLLANRFDLIQFDVGYFAEAAELDMMGRTYVLLRFENRYGLMPSR